jgi:hypothetical protein
MRKNMSLKKHWPLIAAALLVFPATVRATDILGFSTFVSAGAKIDRMTPRKRRDTAE